LHNNHIFFLDFVGCLRYYGTKRREYEMIVDCPKCKKKYRVNESLIPVGGAHVQCPACSNVFSLYRSPLDIPLEPFEEKSIAPPEKEFTVDSEPFKPTREEPAAAGTTVESKPKPRGIDTTIPPVEERTKLWEKLQQSYASEKKTVAEPAADVEQPATIEPTISSEEEASFEVPSRETPNPAEGLTEETATVETPPTEAPTIETATTPPLSEAAVEEITPSEPTSSPETGPSAAVEEAVTEADRTIKEAKRLARSLVKDILLYHGDKVEIGLRQGNLAQLIGNEIRKSWKFYKDSFPLEKTNNVNYFKEALNEIIGKGKPIFK
jgi:predicted Zn finger-like uncharacterized protein